MMFRGQVAGWKASRQGEEGAPLLTDVPLYAVGRLSTRFSPRAGTIFSIGEHDVDTATIRVTPGSVADEWNEEPGGEVADRPWTKTLRVRQEQYRRLQLGLPPGLHRWRGTSRPVQSRLPEWAVAEDPTLNFLADERIYEAVLQRLADSGGGIIEPHRLHHDLLSSQPLCFNLLALPALVDRIRLARALASVLAVDIRTITEVRFEHQPAIYDGYKTGSAFDCYIEYKAAMGSTSFLGIETKYSEDLTRQRPSTNTNYGEITELPDSGWNRGAAARLNQPVTCQLWYNALLAQRAGRHASHPAPTMVLLACADDSPAFAAAQAVAAEAPDGLVRWCSYEELLTLLGKGERLQHWASHFASRYLHQ